MVNPKDILVTTTSTVEGFKVKKFLKPISTHIVAGTGFLSDFAASFSDVFGGRSQAYQRELSSLYDEAIKKLKVSAHEIGANCILGLNIDMDEISGKGKQMFMVTATGTAVIIDDYNKENFIAYSSDKFENISADKVSLLKRKRKIIADAESGNLILDNETWNFIISNQVYEIFDFILLQLKRNIEYDDAANMIYKNIIDLLSPLPEKKKTELLYINIIKEENELLAIKLCNIVESLYLLDFDYVEYILQLKDFKKQKAALRLTVSNKSFYNRQDIEKLRTFIILIKEKFIERGSRSIKKGLLSSKEKEVWTCECGRTNDVGINCYGCGTDIYGFRPDEIKPEHAILRIEELISLISEYVK